MIYKLVSGTNVEDFVLEVNRHLALGWFLHGGPMMGTRRFHQAMVKVETS